MNGAMLAGVASVLPSVQADEAPGRAEDRVYDVAVAGGGPAGIAAAVNAARAGAKTLLVESQGSLGGIWTSGLVSCVIDAGKGETDREIIRRLDELGARHPRARVLDDFHFIYEPEYMKIVCEEMCREAGVDILLHSSVVAASRDASGRLLASFATESKGGRQVWRAKVFVDCTGDGDLAVRAGCGFDFATDGRHQPSSLCALVVVDDADALGAFVANDPVRNAAGGPHRAKEALRAEFARAGVTPSYPDPTLFRLNRRLLTLMANQEYNVPLDDARAITAATVRARAEVHRLVGALARMGGPWQGIRVAATAEALGHRAARSIHGRYRLTREDVVSGAIFEDAVTTSRVNVDFHGFDYASSVKDGAVQSMGVKARPFQIPLRALRARDLDNLFMAGRCISGDRVAHACYRMTGTAVATGEAVGRAAARLAIPGIQV